jgi:hypothetical protein
VADTTYVDNSLPTVTAAWLNDANAVIYRALGSTGLPGGTPPATPTAALSNLISNTTALTSSAATITAFLQQLVNAGTINQATANQLITDILAGDSTHLTSLAQAVISSAFPNPATDLENILINGDMRVSQVAGSTGVAVSNGTNYVIDQWQQTCSTGAGTGNITGTRAGVSGESAGGSQYALQYTVTTANAALTAGQYAETENRSEGLNTQKLNWGTAQARAVTLQFRFYTSIANAVLPIAFVNGAGNRSYVTTITTGAANTWANYSVTIPGDVTGTWPIDNTLSLRVIFCWAAGSSFQTAANAWGAGLFYSVAGATNFMSSTANVWGLTDVDLKAGSLVLPITRRSYEAELLLCSRYLPVFNSSSTSNFLPGAGYFISGTAAQFNVVFPVPVRTPPTGITISAAGHFTNNDGTASIVSTGVAIVIANLNAGLLQLTVAAGGTATHPCLTFMNTASGQLVFTGSQL